MNSPRVPLSGVFVSSAPEPRSPGLRKKSPKRPKALSNSCYPNASRGREEIIQTTCSSSGTSFTRRRSPGLRGTSPEPQSPGGVQRRASTGVEPRSPGGVQRRASTGVEPQSPNGVQRRASIALARNGHSAPCPPGSAASSSPTLRSQAVMPCLQHRNRFNPAARASVKSKTEATKTLDAIDGALRAVETALIKKRGTGDCSPSPSASEVESLCGTECTESTACSSSFSTFSLASAVSEESGIRERRFLPVRGSSVSLRDARRTLKERMGAEERSARFARGLLSKLDELRDAVADESLETA